ncbi:hypothetical protein [Aliiroseovarius marinus]|uniref:hypothetical protein n=1 Tax=Aliiroseovarius marinus TaxID=2500159 RepID=UPI00105B8412|nr:hypothetical protein [Aliiroseovarius marinus]
MNIYEFVVEKLKTHGVEKSSRGKRVLQDQKLLLMFIDLERAVRNRSFDAVLAAANSIEDYLEAIDERPLLVFVYMYLWLSDLTPKMTEVDKELSDGRVRKTYIFAKQITDEERLIGLWAKVKYEEVGNSLLGALHSKS